MRLAIRNRSALAAVALGALALGACASSATKLVHSQVDPTHVEGSVKKVFVVGVARDSIVRHSYEDTMVAELQSLKLTADPSYDLIPDPQQVDKEAVASTLKQRGVTHVLVTRVVQRKEVEQYHAPSTMSVGVGFGGYPGYYGGWGSYMSVGYTTAVSPGYTTVQTVLSVESNLYDLATGKLTWSGLSAAYPSGDPQATIKPYVKSLLWDMRAKQVF